MVEGRAARTPAGVLAGEWRNEAICRGSKVDFFPLTEKSRSVNTEKNLLAMKAIRVCMECPVRMECLEYALETNQSEGIWGGLVPRERKRIRWLRNRKKRSNTG